MAPSRSSISSPARAARSGSPRGRLAGLDHQLALSTEDELHAAGVAADRVGAGAGDPRRGGQRAGRRAGHQRAVVDRGQEPNPLLHSQPLMHVKHITVLDVIPPDELVH